RLGIALAFRNIVSRVDPGLLAMLPALPFVRAEASDHGPLNKGAHDEEEGIAGNSRRRRTQRGRADAGRTGSARSALGPPWPLSRRAARQPSSTGNRHDRARARPVFLQ